MVTSQIRQEATTPEPVLCPTDSFPAVIPVLSLMKVKSGCFSKQKLFLEGGTGKVFSSRKNISTLVALFPYYIKKRNHQKKGLSLKIVFCGLT